MNMRGRLARGLGLAGAGLLTVVLTVQAARPLRLLQGFAQGQLILQTGHHNCIRLDAWFADQPEQQAQGLMFVEQLDEFEGMLFRYQRPAVLTMWMRNTYIPLDMVFIRRDGTVTGIAGNTTPMSEDRISSGEPVTGVLEVNAGFAARWGLIPGARLLLAN
jgi:uncharacterized membrane protein (UPF0127 family)